MKCSKRTLDTSTVSNNQNNSNQNVPNAMGTTMKPTNVVHLENLAGHVEDSTITDLHLRARNTTTKGNMATIKMLDPATNQDDNNSLQE